MKKIGRILLTFHFTPDSLYVLRLELLYVSVECITVYRVCVKNTLRFC